MLVLSARMENGCGVLVVPKRLGCQGSLFGASLGGKILEIEIEGAGRNEKAETGAGRDRATKRFLCLCRHNCTKLSILKLLLAYRGAKKKDRYYML